MKIDGKKLSQQVIKEIEKIVSNLHNNNISPSLAIVTVGKERTWKLFVNQKIKLGKKLNIHVVVINASEYTQNDLETQIHKLNSQRAVNGIIIQRPLRKDINEQDITSIINPIKDVDAFSKQSPYISPVVQAVINTLSTGLNCTEQTLSEKLKSKTILVIGKGSTGGGPISNFFKQKDINHTMIDSKTTNPDRHIKKADIIVSAVGKKVIHKDSVKKGVGLIGVGIRQGANKTKGDYDEVEIKEKASFYTPTPGGIGPLNLAYLFQNVVKATQRQRKQPNAQ